MRVTVFYSWQSDLPNSTNRGFIQRALEKAIESIRAQEELVIEPCLERDTAGVSGTPDIASTIFRKIDECQIFVGDVSIINPKIRNGRKTPNPNVLLELGYAASKLTWDNVICVFNSAYGKLDDLPFDLRLRRMAPYSVREEQEIKAEERDRLAAIFQSTLQPVLLRLERQLQEDNTPKPLSAEQASANVKEYLSEDRYRIQLSDFIGGVADTLSQQIVSEEFPVSLAAQLSEEGIRQRMERFCEISQVAQAVILVGCYFGTKTHEKLWVDLLQRVANPPGEKAGNVVLLNLQHFPALVLLYAGGIAAIAGENFETLLALLSKPKIYDRREQPQSVLTALSHHRVVETDLLNKIFGQRRYTPMSDHLCTLLRQPLRSLLPDDRQYQKCFDRFEYMKSLLSADVTGGAQAIGSFGWRWRYDEQDTMKEMAEEELSLAMNWPPYKAGWFQASRERFTSAKNKVSDAIQQLNWH